MSIKVIGHISPDTDTVCSAISAAWYLTNVKGIEAQGYVSGELNRETSFVLNHFQIELPQKLDHFSSEDNVFIVDTNNPEELLPGIGEAELVGIIDHHKLIGGLKTEKPLEVHMLPLACTATIIWNLIKEKKDHNLPREMAGVMLSAILSDTLKFTSPTTTDVDKSAAEELATICGESIDSLAQNMFDAKSDLSGMSAHDILTVDSKVFEMGSKKVRISVLETTNPQNVTNQATELVNEMITIKESEKSDYMFFFVIDILKSNATLLVSNDEEKSLAEKAFSSSFDGQFLVLPGVVSRKKQIIPSLEPVVSA